VTSSLEAFLGRARGSLLPTPVNGAVAVNARIAGTVEVPSATTKVNAPSLKVGGANGVALNADVAYTPAAVNVQRADLKWEDAQAHVDGRIGLSGDRRIALNVVADDVGVPRLLKVANHTDVPATGTLSAKGTIGGTTERPTAMFAIQGSDLIAYEEKLGSLKSERAASFIAIHAHEIPHVFRREALAAADAARPARLEGGRDVQVRIMWSHRSQTSRWPSAKRRPRSARSVVGHNYTCETYSPPDGDGGRLCGGRRL